MSLASRFAPRSPVLRSDRPLLDDQIRAVVPSIFAETPHESRSQRYSYIPTATVLSELRQEGFLPFMVCQTRVRNEDRREYTKHLIRLRHASQINGDEANEIILLNSHDGTSSYQMLAGQFRFVCQNGLVCGDTFADIRVPHKGDVAGQVIEGAYEVLKGFERVQEARESMRAITLEAGRTTFSPVRPWRSSTTIRTSPRLSRRVSCWFPDAGTIARATSGRSSTASRKTSSREG